MAYELGMKSYMSDLLTTSQYASHLGEGYNVLFGDGHVTWYPDPWRQVVKAMEAVDENNTLSAQRDIFDMFDFQDSK